MHGGPAQGHLAKLRRHSQHNPRESRHHERWNVCVYALLFTSAPILVHPIHQGLLILLFLGHLKKVTADSVQKVQYFFAFKSFIAPIVFLAIFGDTLRKAGGTVSNSNVISGGPTKFGSALAWAFFGSELTADNAGTCVVL